METEKLDNPAWHSLDEYHKDFAVDYQGTKFYDPAYCAFGGFINIISTEKALETYSLLADSFYIVGDKPVFDNTVQLNKELICNQMLPDKPVEIEITEIITLLETATQKKDLFELVNVVQPGYFKNKTVDLGSYYGIYKDGQLIAATGERMKMNAYTEVSAVVTHPEHTGKGYAKQLVAYTSNKIFDENKPPYLHVAETNTGAIGLYEKLGYRTRRKISFWHFLTTRS